MSLKSGGSQGRARRVQRRARLPQLIAMVNFVALLALASAQAVDGGAKLRIVAFGDSLTAGFGLRQSQSFPAQLAKALNAKGYNADVVNSGVSGDTTGSGLARFDWAIADGTDAVILELGANDALRGLDPKLIRRNLESIVTKLKARNIEVLIAGMIAPRNLGADYAGEFDAIFADLAGEYDLVHYPFFLDGVALDPRLNQPDGLHPTAEGIERIVDGILPSVEKLIRRVESRKNGATKS